MIRFGSMSIVLLLGAAYGVLFMALLWWTRCNRLANRLLALLLGVIALQLLPYIIGYAGFYDAFPWLSFAPWQASLAFGPLLYLYLRRLNRPALPHAWGWHFAPVALQLGYYMLLFVQPLAFKNDWDGRVHVPWVVPVEQLATFASIAGYWALSLRQHRAYQRWLADSLSTREEHHQDWTRNFLVALGLTLLLWVGLAAWQRWVADLNYFEEFPFYLWFALLSYYLGTEGYRHARHVYPVWPGPDPAPPAPAVTSTPVAPVPAALPGPAALAPAAAADWTARGARWRQRVQDEGLWRNPELSLAGLARHLGTNTSDLSRAFNEGLGQNFNELINRLRVAAVQQALDQPGEGRGLLDVAFEAGFSSKASFNRCFKLYTGHTPSAYAALAPARRPGRASDAGLKIPVTSQILKSE